MYMFVHNVKSCIQQCTMLIAILQVKSMSAALRNVMVVIQNLVTRPYPYQNRPFKYKEKRVNKCHMYKTCDDHVL